MKKILEDTHAQISLGTLFTIIMVIIVFSALTPTLNYFVNYGVTQLGAGSQASIIIQLWPLAIVIAIMWGIFIRARPYYDRYAGAE